MNQKSIVNWEINVWPDTLKTQAADCLASHSTIPIFASESIQWNCSFAIGFFGFHYVRAAKEDEPSLRNKSLQILHKLILACNFDRDILGHLKEPQDWELLDFWDHVIRKLSIALGDSLGPENQQMVELGFWLAAVYAGLVEESSRGNNEKIAQYLKYLKECLSDLIKSSYLAGIPEPVIRPLTDSIKFLGHSKTSATASKCMNLLKVAIYKFLSFEIIEELIHKFPDSVARS